MIPVRGSGGVICLAEEGVDVVKGNDDLAVRGSPDRGAVKADTPAGTALLVALPFGVRLTFRVMWRWLLVAFVLGEWFGLWFLLDFG